MNKLKLCFVLLEIFLFLGVPLFFKTSEIVWVYMLIWPLTMPLSFVINRIKGYVKTSYFILICITIIHVIRFTCLVNAVDLIGLGVVCIFNEVINLEWWLPLIGHIVGDIIENIYSKK